MTDKQKKFCDEYLKSGNATQSYIKVYNSTEETANVNACKLLRNTSIKEYLNTKRSDIEKKEVVTREKIINELSAIAFSNGTDYATIKDGMIELKDTDTLSEMSKKAIVGIEPTQAGVKIKTADKVRAIELLSRIMGYDKDNSLFDEQMRKLDEVLEKMGGNI